MRFILSLVFWLILIGLGFLVGDRYGAPGVVSGAVSPAFEAIEGKIGVSPQAEDTSDADGKKN